MSEAPSRSPQIGHSPLSRKGCRLAVRPEEPIGTTAIANPAGWIRQRQGSTSPEYQAFAKEGLELVPDEVAAGYDDVDFEELIVLSRAWAEELAAAATPRV